MIRVRCLCRPEYQGEPSSEIEYLRIKIGQLQLARSAPQVPSKSRHT